jgi:hypothetical protein
VNQDTTSGWNRASYYTEHGTLTWFWFEHPWTATTTPWVTSPSELMNFLQRLKNSGKNTER